MYACQRLQCHNIILTLFSLGIYFPCFSLLQESFLPRTAKLEEHPLPNSQWVIQRVPIHQTYNVVVWFGDILSDNSLVLSLTRKFLVKNTLPDALIHTPSIAT